ncbi:hypothetical protein FH972_004863 [Carpinus fangiana]|uniref:Alcohol dehydrogenase-like N-terminal domain-containing protein n=1 Tax=Carpinus fangiana TaxID=176857 RepID=A0A5N6QQZ6_9ROSI|nr:hypothetical protein FH972_004863 [Carpinus fangiana]
METPSLLHEIVGIVKEVGTNVHRFKVGNHVAVGTYVNSCRDCEFCNKKLEVHCAKGVVYTFNGIDTDGTITKGGYSDYIVVHERQVLYIMLYCYTIPDSYPLASAAPLLCAGITVYAPMMCHKMNQAGKSLGVIGLGGLGHMAVNTSISKKEEALSFLGANKFAVSSDQEEMEALVKPLDFIIDVAFEMRTITGSGVGGTKDIQEMLNFCAAHKIYPQIKVVPIQYANEALERLLKKDVKYRFVIDVENSLK